MVGATVALGYNPQQKGIYPPLNYGVINVDITQDNINQNICNPHWSTKSIRPPVSYTNKLKLAQIKVMGYTDTNLADYEEDHVISLELGGHPTDVMNLWPESYKTTPNARDKDKTEGYLHRQVCSGAMSLTDAQKAISTDWVKVFNSIPKSTTLGSTGDESSTSDD